MFNMPEESQLFSLKLPKSLFVAMTTAAETDFCSKNDIVRQGLVRILSERGLMPTTRPDSDRR